MSAPDPVKILNAKVADAESQAAAARAIGCSKSQLSCILRRLQKPGLRTASKIEKVYGIPASSWHRAA